MGKEERGGTAQGGFLLLGLFIRTSFHRRLESVRTFINAGFIWSRFLMDRNQFPLNSSMTANLGYDQNEM